MGWGGGRGLPKVQLYWKAPGPYSEGEEGLQASSQTPGQADPGAAHSSSGQQSPPREACVQPGVTTQRLQRVARAPASTVWLVKAVSFPPGPLAAHRAHGWAPGHGGCPESQPRSQTASSHQAPGRERKLLTRATQGKGTGIERPQLDQSLQTGTQGGTPLLALWPLSLPSDSRGPRQSHLWLCGNLSS